MKLTGYKENGVFLWMLEQERQRSHKRVFKNNCCDPETYSPGISQDSYVNVEILREVEVKPTVPVVANGLEQFTKEKAGLEAEWHRLNEQQQELSLRAKALCAKIIPELKIRNKMRKQAVDKLRARVSRLQTQFDGLFEADVSSKHDWEHAVLVTKP